MSFRTSSVEKMSAIESAKSRLGWAYPHCRWLTEEAGKSATRERDEILYSLRGRMNFAADGSKIYQGELSPGCLTCANGQWSCLYLNRLCNTHCFFCPQNRSIHTEQLPQEQNNTVFEDPDTYAAYLKRFKFKGVGLSGGEPLLARERALKFIRTARDLGDEAYIWLYTNGKLVDEKVLVELKSAGINELRFNITADNYCTDKVNLARRYLDKVTVEIPSIPEDHERLKGVIGELSAIGVDYVNLHQLNATAHNYRDLVARKYTMLHHPFSPIMESELCALRLLRYVADRDIKVALHYCTQSYKTSFQLSAARRRSARLVKKPHEGITSAGFLRSLSLKDSPERLKKTIGALKKSKCKPNLWQLDEVESELSLHATLLKHIDFEPQYWVFRYFIPFLTENAEPGADARKIQLLKKSIFAVRSLCFVEKSKSPAPVGFLSERVADGARWQSCYGNFMKNYRPRAGARATDMVNDLHLLQLLRGWEEIEGGFPELY